MTPILFLFAYFIGLIATLTRPVVGIFLYAAVYLLNPTERWWSADIPDFRYSFVVALFTLISFFVHGYAGRALQIAKHPIFLCWGAFVLLHAIVGLWALVPDKHNVFSEHMLTVFVLGVMTATLITNRKQLTALFSVFVFGALYMGYLGWSQGRTGGDRLEGIGTKDAPDSNAFAAMIAAIVPLAIYLALHGSRWQKALVLIATPFILNVLVLINSRGAFLALTVGAAYLVLKMLHDSRLTRQLKLRLLGSLLIGAIAFVYLADKSFWERMGTIYVDESAGEVREGSSAGRLKLWQAAVKMIPEWPLGGGLYTFGIAAYPHLPENVRGRTERGRAVHSVWFEVILELGWLGSVIYVLLLFSFWRACGRIERRAGADDATRLLCSTFLTSLIVCLVAFTFLDSMRQEILFWLCAMLVALEFQSRELEVSSVSTTPTQMAASPSRRRSIYWRHRGGSN